ncbi:hypothetical protein GY45DRAFT_720767 [Cubamyces sp. BRFM 1775]|nr:hypothetical protein GY45DRAFT_720767 [Cubamyces sp. BRFM 1775]
MKLDPPFDETSLLDPAQVPCRDHRKGPGCVSVCSSGTSCRPKFGRRSANWPVGNVAEGENIIRYVWGEPCCGRETISWPSLLPDAHHDDRAGHEISFNALIPHSRFPILAGAASCCRSGSERFARALRATKRVGPGPEVGPMPKRGHLTLGPERGAADPACVPHHISLLLMTTTGLRSARHVPCGDAYKTVRLARVVVSADAAPPHPSHRTLT